MSKNNSTVKNVRRNALEVIIQGLSLSDSEKLKLHEDLRSMRIADDNDPIVKFTMLQGLLAQYNGETAQKIVHERENIEDTVETIKEFLDRFSRGVLELRNRDLAELKKNIKLWNNEVIIGTQEMIVELRYEKECLDNNIKNEQEKFDKVKEEIYEAKKERDEIKNSCSNYIIGTFAACVIIVLISGLIISLIWTFEKKNKVEKYSKAVECRDTLECDKTVKNREKIESYENEETCTPTLKVANSPPKLDSQYKQLLEEYNNESDPKKRSEILDKIINL